jgi:hypothetical protein
MLLLGGDEMIVELENEVEVVDRPCPKCGCERCIMVVDEPGDNNWEQMFWLRCAECGRDGKDAAYNKRQAIQNWEDGY